MDNETLWVLKKLSTRDISAVSAERILRALECLRRSEQGGTAGSLVSEKRQATTEIPQVKQEIAAEMEEPAAETEQEIAAEEAMPAKERETEEFSPGVQEPLLEDNDDVVSQDLDQTHADVAGLCPTCGVINSPDAVFCNGCGAELGKTLPPPIQFPLPLKLQNMWERIENRLPQDLAERLSADAKEMQGEQRLVTAVFINVSREHNMLLCMFLDRCVNVMSECLRMILDVISVRHEGCISRITDNRVLALFGAPIIHEDDAKKAILAALDIRSGVEELGLDVSIGINTGLVNVDGMDDEFYLECSSWSSDVELANMLQDVAGHGEIRVGMSTYRLTDKAFDFDEPTDITIGEMAEPQIAYRVLGISDYSERLMDIDDLDEDI